MRNSSLVRRTEKIAQRMIEIENEVKEFHNSSDEIVRICTGLVQKMKAVADVETFLEEFITTYRYLSSCALAFSEFNCKLESLRLGYEVTPPILQIAFPAKIHNDKSPRELKKVGCLSRKGEKSQPPQSVNIFGDANGGNRSEKTQPHDVSSVSGFGCSAKEQNSLEAQEDSAASGIQERGLDKRAAIGSAEGSHERTQPDRQPNEEVAEVPETTTQSAISSTSPQPPSPNLGLAVPVPASGCCNSPEAREIAASRRKPSAQVVPVKSGVCGSGRAVENGFADKESETEETGNGKRREKPGKNLRELKIDREVGVIHDVILSHLVSPDEFYVFVKCEELKLLEELRKKLSDSIKYTESDESLRDKPWPNQLEKKLAAETFGSYALSYSEDTSTRSRIEILDWRMEERDDLILVSYVDDGASGLLPLRRMLPMPEILAKYPIFVQKCYLSFIAPAGGEWSEEDKTVFEIFTESTDNKSHLKMEVTERDGAREDGALGVKLFLPESRICINDKLREYGIAVAKKDDAVDTHRETSEDLRGRFLPACAVGEKIPVKVTCILRVNHIFCVKDYEKTKETDVLQNLIAYLNNPETESDMSPLEKEPRVGDLVIGKYEDGLWYRAQVVKSNPNSGVCRILFLDYGNTGTVSVKELRKMESKYLKIPFQMVECLLEGVQLKLTADQHEAVKYLNERIAEHTTISIKKVLNRARSLYSVRICDRSGQDVANQLIAAGHATSTAGGP